MVNNKINTYKRRFRFVYDSIYTGDWGFIPNNIYSNIYVNSKITNRYFVTFNQQTNVREKNSSHVNGLEISWNN